MLANVFYILAAFLLVLLNGFFVAAEFALVKLRHTQAVGLAERIGWRGRILLGVHERLDAYLSACQLGITLSSLGLGWIGEPAFATLLEPVFARIGGFEPDTIHIISFVLAFTIIAFLHIVLGELAPKSLAIRRPERVSVWTATPLYAFYWIMYPAIWVLNGSANLMLRLFGLDEVSGHEHHYSRDELKLIVHANRAVRDSGEAFAMMSHALDLPELVAGDLLRTRDQLGALHDGQDQEQVLAEIRRSQFSRYPWFDEGFEHVRGILHVKDLLLALAENGTFADMTSLLRPAIVVPLDTPILEMLRRFRTGRTQFALVTEDSGRVVGFFTLFDVVQIIVGDIEDEHRNTPGHSTQRAADGSFTIPGSMPIYRLERLLDQEIESPDEVNSVGGLIVHRLERLPTEGESLVFDGFTLIVRTMKGARAQAITVTPDRSLQTDTESP
ncbi:MAG TPA: hemolysin family protein [Dokdonella sp.]|uniref:hemolysin family protein n=3 Tax=Dokdonella sp. TaxID=2291710 RepID=UPI002C6589CC|nr:hemolysin family protein [Dokdonella sp.]HOX70324.1 hemolysin family protein [Dokdonella sp.]HPG95303.1 hemolysin family protein [Dokdonella sp.]HPN79292.1 hemolysin family protein [Dokdonella sp.]